MDRQSLPVGTVFGIPVRVDLSWFLIVALVTWSLAAGYFPAEYSGWTPLAYWLVGAATATLFFGSVFLHELAHSLVAQRFKIPVKTITLYIFGGLSELETEPPAAWTWFWITVSGPAVNLLLAGLFALLALVVSAAAPLEALAKYLAYINLILGLFNLIPGYPLDGGSALMSIIWGLTGKKRWGIVAAATIGSLVAYFLILVGVMQLFGGNVMNGIWTAFIGWFMLNASGGVARQERLKEALAGHRVAEAMSKNYVIVYPETTLQCLVDEHILVNGRRSFLVGREGQLMGMLTLHAFQDVPRAEWATQTAAQVMIPAAKVISVQPETELLEAIQAMDRDGVNQLPVLAGGQIQGVLAREDVINFLRRLQAGSKGLRPLV